jgi:hypothetical protein
LTNSLVNPFSKFWVDNSSANFMPQRSTKTRHP